MSYTCPDCEDGILEAKVREVDLELKGDETARVIGGVALVTTVACSNGCSSESDDEEEEKPKRKKRAPATAATASDDACQRSELCSKQPGHNGRCNTKLAERVEA